MARPEVTGRKIALLDVADDADAYSIDEFCAPPHLRAALLQEPQPDAPHVQRRDARLDQQGSGGCMASRARAGGAGR
jgi:hypothetical protein